MAWLQPEMEVLIEIGSTQPNKYASMSNWALFSHLTPLIVTIPLQQN